MPNKPATVRDRNQNTFKFIMIQLFHSITRLGNNFMKTKRLKRKPELAPKKGNHGDAEKKKGKGD